MGGRFRSGFRRRPHVFGTHATIRKANKISPKATVQRVEMEDELKHGFFVHYDNGQTTEVSWSFVRELPPKNSKK